MSLLLGAAVVGTIFVGRSLSSTANNTTGRLDQIVARFGSIVKQFTIDLANIVSNAFDRGDRIVTNVSLTAVMIIIIISFLFIVSSILVIAYYLQHEFSDLMNGLLPSASFAVVSFGLYLLSYFKLLPQVFIGTWVRFPEQHKVTMSVLSSILLIASSVLYYNFVKKYDRWILYFFSNQAIYFVALTVYTAIIYTKIGFDIWIKVQRSVIDKKEAIGDISIALVVVLLLYLPFHKDYRGENFEFEYKLDSIICEILSESFDVVSSDPIFLRKYLRTTTFKTISHFIKHAAFLGVLYPLLMFVVACYVHDAAAMARWQRFAVIFFLLKVCLHVPFVAPVLFIGLCLHPTSLSHCHIEDLLRRVAVNFIYFAAYLTAAVMYLISKRGPNFFRDSTVHVSILLAFLLLYARSIPLNRRSEWIRRSIVIFSLFKIIEAASNCNQWVCQVAFLISCYHPKILLSCKIYELIINCLGPNFRSFRV